MPKGYVIGRARVTNATQWGVYAAEASKAIAQYGGKPLVRGGLCAVGGGGGRPRNVVLEFPSYQAALDCYNSPEYQKTIALRAPHSTADIMVIEGYDGPQP